MPEKKKTVSSKKTEYTGGIVEEIYFNVDDMTGEEISFANDRIMEAGASEVYTTPVFMKKNRPGILFTVICQKERHEPVLDAIFRHTSTIGVRCHDAVSYRMNKNVVRENTGYGQIHKKIAAGHNYQKEKYEFEDLKKIAEKNGLTIKELLKALDKER